MSKLRRIIANTLISFIGQAVNWTSTVLLTVAYGRYLGPVQFGELVFAIAFVGLVGVPVNSGFDRQTIRDVAQQPEKAASYLSNMLLIRMGIWALLCAVFLLAAWLLGYSPQVRLLVAICGFDLLCNALSNTFASMHYAFERTIFPVVGNTLEKGLSALFGILLLMAGAGVVAMAVVIVVGSLINLVWQAVWYLRLVRATFTVEPALMRHILHKNIPFFINGALWTGYTTIDTVLLAFMTSSLVVGWYGAATRLFDTMSFLPTIVITSVMFPIFAKLSLVSDADLKLAFEKSVNFLLLCGMPIATLLIFGAPDIIPLLYGKHGFEQSIPVLQAVAPGVVFAFLNYALSSTLLSKKLERKLPIVSGIALAFNLALNLVLIHLYQAIGAAIASTLTEVLVCCCLAALQPRHLLPFASLVVWLKALLASLAMAAAMLALRAQHFFVVLPIALLVYAAAAVIIGVIPREDYLALYRALRQKTRTTHQLHPKDLPEVATPASGANALLEIEVVTTVKLPAMRKRAIRPVRLQELQPRAGGVAESAVQACPADTSLEDGSEITVKLTPMRRRASRLGQIVPVSEHNVPNGERFDI